MSVTNRPAGYNTLSPYIVAPGAQAVIDFAKTVFDAVELRRYDLPGGAVMHAEFRIGDTVVMIGDAGPQCPPVPAWMHVYVDDVDATYLRALAAGAASLQEPTQRPGESDKRGGVKDPSGNSWWIATQVQA